MYKQSITYLPARRGYRELTSFYIYTFRFLFVSLDLRCLIFESRCSTFESVSLLLWISMFEFRCSTFEFVFFSCCVGSSMLAFRVSRFDFPSSVFCFVGFPSFDVRDSIFDARLSLRFPSFAFRLTFDVRLPMFELRI